MLNIILILVLLIVVYQDFKYREINISLFIILLVIFIIQGLKDFSFFDYLKECRINFLFLLFQITTLFIYGFYRNRSIFAILDKSIGLGDLALLFTTGFAFSTLNFVAFYLTSLLFSLICWLIYKWVYSKDCKLIPLAGLISSFMILIVLAESFSSSFERFTDNYLISLIYG